MGFNWVFVNPIHRPGMSGSLYSVVDYFQLNPKLADPESSLSLEQQMRDVSAFAETKGVRMMVDLVVSHSAIDSELTRSHPEWYERQPNGEIAHPSCTEDGKTVVWGDLAKFNHEHTSDPEGLYCYLHDVVVYLIELGFTGFRCDAAYQIPRHFWERLIGDIKGRYSDIIFTAETLGCTAEETKVTASAGFDYVFNSSKWWDFHSPWLMSQYQLTRQITHSISFPESHDTERLAHEVQGNIAAIKQRYLFSALFSAGVMMPVGFEFGFRKPLHVVETEPEDWEETDIDLCEFINDVNRIKSRYQIFQEDSPAQVRQHENPNILMMWKASASTPEEALIVLNKDPWNHQHFYLDRLQDQLQAGAPLTDVSPEYPLKFIPTEPFAYDLRPGQAFVMVTERD